MNRYEKARGRLLLVYVLLLVPVPVIVLLFVVVHGYEKAGGFLLKQLVIVVDVLKVVVETRGLDGLEEPCLLYTSPSPRDS